MSDTLDIAELARKAGVSSRTIRYYGELGLLHAEARGVGGRRLYDSDALERLRFIGRLKHLGMTLDAIRELNQSFDRGHTPAMLEQLEEMLRSQLAEVAERRAELDRLDSDLRHYLGRIHTKQTVSR